MAAESLRVTRSLARWTPWLLRPARILNTPRSNGSSSTTSAWAERSWLDVAVPYLSEPLTKPPPSLSATATVRWRPLVPISVIGPTGKRRFFPRGLLDPGADDTVFPFAVAALLGVTLRTDGGHGLRRRGQAFSLRFGDVSLEMSDGRQFWRWPAIIGLSSAPVRYPILGLAGCLQFFDARFRGKDQVVELETNSAYPGTK